MQERVTNLFKPYKGLPKEIYVIFFAKVINALGAFVYPLMTLIMTKKIGLTTVEAGFWISVQGLLFMPASFLGGKLADTIGRKKIIVIFDLLGAAIYICCAFMEPSMNIIYLIMLCGLMFGMTDPAHYSLVADLTTPDNREGAFSLTYMGFNLGYAVGPIIGGLLFENYLKWLFIGDAITLIIATLLILIFIKETINHVDDELDEDRKLEEKVEGSTLKVLFSRPILLWFSLIMLGYNFVYAQWGFLMPMHSEFNFVNQGAKLYGFLGAFNGLIVIIFTPIITSVFSKTTNLRKVFLGGILYTIGFGMLGFWSIKPAFFIAVLIFTLGEVIISIGMMPFIANHTPASHRGRMNALLPIIMGFGYILSPSVIGKILSYSSISSAWKIVGIVMAISTLLMMILDKRDNLSAKK